MRGWWALGAVGFVCAGLVGCTFEANEPKKKDTSGVPSSPPHATANAGGVSGTLIIETSVAELFSANAPTSSGAGISENYGLYTYVLLGRSTRDANLALIKQVLSTTSSSTVVDTDVRHSVNLIGVPIAVPGKVAGDRKALDEAAGKEESVWMKTANKILDDYDYSLSDRVRLAYCHAVTQSLPPDMSMLGKNAKQQVADFCQDQMNGPAMLTVTRAIEWQKQDYPMPFLVFDFSGHPTNMYARYVDQYKTQVTRPNFANGNIRSMMYGLLEVGFAENKLVDPLVNGLKGLISVSQIDSKDGEE